MMRTLIIRSWWLLLFLALFFVGFDQVMRHRQKECDEVEARLAQLAGERVHLTAIQEELYLQIASQNDPGWIEMALMKGLGLVPEGQIKVYFRTE